jgi:putative FmdB family regulatory protein
MPLYQYQCRKCGTVFDDIGSMDSSNSQRPCQRCSRFDDDMDLVMADRILSPVKIVSRLNVRISKKRKRIA